MLHVSAFPSTEVYAKPGLYGAETASIDIDIDCTDATKNGEETSNPKQLQRAQGLEDYAARQRQMPMHMCRRLTSKLL